MRNTSMFRAGLGEFCVVLSLAGFASGALAQQAANPPANPPPVITAPAESPAQAVPPPGPSAPVLPKLPTPAETIGAIGRFFDQSISNVGAGMKGAGAAASVAGDLAKGVGSAAGAVARLPLSSAVSGWEPCPVAANGAPDCEVASVALCRTKGFSAGKSVDITSAQKCPAAVWLEKRQPNDAECKNESFVSKALCQ